jgi:hypothetical protein
MATCGECSRDLGALLSEFPHCSTCRSYFHFGECSVKEVSWRQYGYKSKQSTWKCKNCSVKEGQPNPNQGDRTAQEPAAHVCDCNGCPSRALVDDLTQTVRAMMSMMRQFAVKLEDLTVGQKKVLEKLQEGKQNGGRHVGSTQAAWPAGAPEGVAPSASQTANSDEPRSVHTEVTKDDAFQFQRPQRKKIERQQRRKKEISAGKASGSTLAAITPPERPPRRKKLFLSRLRPEINSAAVKRHVESNITIDAVDVFQLKTKRSEYASFCVVVNEVDFEKINDPVLWPENSIYCEYFGPLFKDRLLQPEEDPKDFAFQRSRMEDRKPPHHNNGNRP